MQHRGAAAVAIAVTTAAKDRLPANQNHDKAAERPLNEIQNKTMTQPEVVVAPAVASPPPTAFEAPPVNGKKKSLLKKIGRTISDQALDILSDGGDKIHVAGFAIHVDR